MNHCQLIRLTSLLLFLLPTAAHAQPVDADGDGFDDTVDCDDTDYRNYPGNTELCDGLDNNCDGLLDEGFDVGAPCDGADVDGCAGGVLACSAGGGVECTEAVDLGVRAWVDFSEGVGFTVGDNSGNGNEGRLIGGTWIPGLLGNAVDFDGVDDYLIVEAGRSCTQLGWPVVGGSAAVCGATDPGGSCSDLVDFEGAVAFCASNGARLCTLDELNADETATTGCGYDDARVWTQTPCADGSLSTQAGSSLFKINHPLECTPQADPAYARCCADEPSNTSLELGATAAQTYTIEAWIRPDQLSGVQIIAAKANPDGNANERGIALQLSNNKVNFGRSACNNFDSNAALTVGVWTHLAATWDGAVGSIYIDGLLDRTANNPSNCATVDSWPLYIGAVAYGPGVLREFFDGAIDRVVIYDRALSATEVARAYDSLNDELGIDSDGDGMNICAGDCDDNDPNIFLGNVESCNGLDDNCDGVIDDGLNFDDDLDAHFAPGSCNTPDDDCDDSNPQVYPGHLEICDLADNNCDGVVDENFPLGEICDGGDADGCPGGVYTCSASGGVDCDERPFVDALIRVDFEEAYGFTVHDQSGNGNTGSVLGGTWTQGVMSGAMQFDGVDDYMIVESSQSCTQLGWLTDNGGTEEVCAATSPGGSCSGLVDFEGALAFCALNGGRLCTQSEMDADETADSGCFYNTTRIWTQTACADGAVITQAGHTLFNPTIPRECTPIDSTANVRCCADNSKSGGNLDLVGDPSTVYSIEAWVRPERLTGVQVIVVKGTPVGGNQSGIALQLNNDKVNFGRALCGNFDSAASLTIGTWHHLLGTWNGVTGSIYIDGAFDSSANNPSNCALVDSWPLFIGAAAVGQGTILEYFEGAIDRVAIYDTVLTAADAARAWESLNDESDFDMDGLSICAGDCDDSDGVNFPGNVEICDGLDNDCDGITPPDEVDVDRDGLMACDDCDDLNRDTYPGAEEICDGFDNDCDQVIPDAEADMDSDGAPVCSDCDDDDPQRFPGAEELCDNIDNNCDDLLPDDEADRDGDSFPECSDCDDADETRYPGAAEICNQIDTDCDGNIDNDCETEVGGGCNCATDRESAVGAPQPALLILLILLWMRVCNRTMSTGSPKEG